MRESNNIKKGEIQFEARAAREQRIERLQFHPIRSYRTDPFFRWRIDTICDKLVPAEGDRILDIGSASCEVAEFLVHLGCNVIAIDISSDMLKLGKERIFNLSVKSQVMVREEDRSGSKIKLGSKMWRHNPRENIHFVVGDCERLPFRSGTFDKIICWATLHHMLNPEITLREMVRVLEKEGKCLLFEPNALNVFRRLQEVTWSSPNLETSFYPWSLRNLLDRAGFEIKSLSYVRPSISVASEEHNTIHRAIKIVYTKISRRKPWKYIFGEIAAFCVPR